MGQQRAGAATVALLKGAAAAAAGSSSHCVGAIDGRLAWTAAAPAVPT